MTFRSTDAVPSGRRHRVVIVGAGPAGLTAAIYAARANLGPLVIAGEAALPQLVAAGEIASYPGFPDGIEGSELLALFRQHAERFGATFDDREATAVDLDQRPLAIHVGRDRYEADTLILATGASPSALGLPSEETFRGRGVSSCATCDGFFFRDKEVVVVGDGDTAVEEALVLSRFASRVRLLAPAAELHAGAVIETALRANPVIEVRPNVEVVDILGDATVDAVRVRDTVEGSEEELRTQGVFVALGYRPDTRLVGDRIPTDDGGYLAGPAAADVEGVFIAGDLHDHAYRQVLVAAADGCKAAIDAERWLARTQGIRPATPTNW
jgi:thioredoxin reductase (NADPH)